MFEDCHPCDAVLTAQEWIRAMTGRTRDQVPDPEFLVNRQNGLPENTVISIETLGFLQYLAVKGLLKELNTKVRPEELLSLLNKSNSLSATPAEASTPLAENEAKDLHVMSNDTKQEPHLSLGTLCVSGLVSTITDYPLCIGCDSDDCGLVLLPSLVRFPHELLPLHCVVDYKDNTYSLEALGSCQVDNELVSAGSIVTLRPGSTISICGCLINFFPQY